jgi:crotonobetainyl-CoA:carnitine CoA-transferase CaiB-like acyl-CoA transferase
MKNGKAPLEGYRVIDLGRQQAGPRCAQVLARLGAEVIKVERLGGEETRYSQPWVGKQSAYWVQYNSGKKSLSINLRTEKGKEVLRKLVKVSDVVLQNFRPGTIEKMGFGYETLKELNPKVIMVNVSAYGQFGPYSERIGVDPIGQTISGITMTTGSRSMPHIRTGEPIIDRTTALHAAIGTLAALIEREVSGEGQSIDVCLADTGYSYTEIPVSAYHGTKVTQERGEDAGIGAGGGIFPCKDGWVLITLPASSPWPRVCDAINKPEWKEDPRFTSRHARSANRDIVSKAIMEFIAEMTPLEAAEHFVKYDVVASPANTIAQAAEDPHPWERGALKEVPDFLAGTIAVSGDFWHFSRTPAVVGSTPRVGEHNEEILAGLLGYSPEEIAEMRQEKVIGEWDNYDKIPGTKMA